MKPKLEEEIEPHNKQLLLTQFPKEDKSIHKLFPIQVIKNYNGIIDINSNNNNFMMFIDNNYDIFGLYHGDINNNNINEENNKHKSKNKNNSKNNSKNSSRKGSNIDNINNNNINENGNDIISFYKINQGIKFPNYYTMSFGENYWIL